MFVRIGVIIGATSLVAVPDAGAQSTPLESHRLLADQQQTFRNVVGDVDEDGHLDVLTRAGTNQVLIGHGDGTFTAAPVVDVLWGDDPTLADMDGDGHLDLGFAMGLADQVRFWLGDGHGAFVPASPGDTSKNANDLEVADFDGDGALDVVVACEDGVRVSVLLGAGDGGFLPNQDYGPVGDRPATVGAGDLDGDGFPDFAVANFYSDTIDVFLNDGRGGFGGSTVYGTGLVGFGLEAPAFADLDEDGDVDVVVATAIGPYTFDGMGDGSLAPAVAVPSLGGGVDTATPIDVDEDGHLDLLVHGGSRVQINRGLGDGSFAAPTLVGVGVGALDLDIADFDEDGDVDLLTGHFSSKGLVLVRGHGDGTFEGLLPVSGSPEDVAVADLDGDGHLDLLAGGDDYASGGLLTAFLGDGEGHLGAAVTSPGLEDMTDLDLGDLDEDGIPDVALVRASALSPRTGWARGLGDGSFGPVVDLLMGVDLDAVRLADMDGDGHLDVVVASTGNHSIVIRAGNGDGTFEPAVVVGSWFSPVDVLTDDMDGDGLPDLTTLHNASGRTLQVRRGLGGLAFEPALWMDFGGAGQGGRLASADLDQDGHLDVLATSVLPGDVAFLAGQGDGTFAAPVGYASPSSDARRVSLGDVDRDGDIDVVVAFEWRFFDQGAVSVFLNDGSGVLAPGVDVATTKNPTSVALADLDGDGALEAVLAGSGSGQVEVLRNPARPFTNRGHGLAGTAGIPRQIALGENAPGSPFIFALDDALPFGSAFWVLGLGDLSAAFKGGTLVPSPDVIVGPFPLDGSGHFAFAGAGPVLPAGVELFYQWWLSDPAGAAGFAASNAIRGLTY